METAEVDGARSSEYSDCVDLKQNNKENTGKDELLEHQCQPCLSENKSVQAYKFCVECNECLCKDCVKDHKKFSITRQHRIEDKKVHTDEISTTLNAGTCLCHPSKYLDQFCETHVEFCCDLCLKTKHRECKAKTTINEGSSKLSEKEINDARERIVKAKVKLQQAKATRTDNVEILHDQWQDTLYDIEKIRNDLEIFLEHVHEKHRKTVEKKRLKLQTKLQNDIETCNEMEESLKEAEKAFECGNKVKQFVTVKQLVHQLDDVEATANAIAHDVPKKCLVLKRTSLCTRILNQPDLLIDFTQKVRLYKAKGQAQQIYTQGFYALQTHNKNNFSCIYQEPSNLIFTLPSSVCIFDTVGEKTEQIKISGQISSIAVEQDNFFFIALQDKVLVVTAGEKGSTVLNTDTPCVGIIKLSKIFFVTVINKTVGELREYSTDGTMTRVLKTNENGVNVFTNGIGEVKISRNEKRIYVVDRNIGIVIISAADFKVLRIVSNLNHPTGITFLDGSVLFILLENGEVQQTTDEGETFDVVLQIDPSGGEGPRRVRLQKYYSICCDGYSSMYVACSSVNGLNLCVMRYQLEVSYK